MATQTEIEAAAAGIRDAMPGLISPEAWPWLTLARAALEAAERVRPRRDLTAAARMRQSRAKRRAERAVTREVTPERAVTGDVTRAVTRDAAPIDKIDSERASILSSRPLLLANLIEAADGNVAPGAVDVAPIQVLLAAGCDLDLDVLPVVRDLATSQTPIKRWDHPGLIRAILRGRDIRIAPKAPLPSPPARQHSPGVPRFDMDELVAGYRAGNVDWDTNRLGPPPGAPGCRVDASILRENGY